MSAVTATAADGTQVRLLPVVVRSFDFLWPDQIRRAADLAIVRAPALATRITRAVALLAEAESVTIDRHTHGTYVKVALHDYTIVVEPDGGERCTCPDFQYRREEQDLPALAGGCKHVHAVRLLLDLGVLG